MTTDVVQGRPRRTVQVAVGADGHLEDETLGFVGTLAQALGFGIEVVHVVPLLVGTPLSGGWYDAELVEQLRRDGLVTLEHATERVRAAVPESVPVTNSLLRGSTAVELVHHSLGAELVVLEHRQRGEWEARLSRSVTASVAARAHAPVISVPVPATDAPFEFFDPDAPIVVGVEDTARAPAELWTAVGLAAVFDRSVRAVRAVHAPRWSGAGSDPARQLAALADCAEALRRDAALPTHLIAKVPVRFDALWGDAAGVLATASERAALLVVGRRDPLLPIGSHLGPVIHDLLDHARCPVVIVEPGVASGLTPGYVPTPLERDAS